MVLTPSPLLQPGSNSLTWNPPAPLQEGWGEEGCHRQSKVLPPPLASSHGGTVLGLSLQTFSSLGSPRPSSTAYVKGFAFPNGPTSPQGCEEERW